MLDEISLAGVMFKAAGVVVMQEPDGIFVFRMGDVR